MKLFIASEVEKERLDAFLQTTDQIDYESLLQEGYVVQIEGELKGCFVLSTLEEGVYWLNQLYITKEEAQRLPVLIETIIVLARTKQAKKLYVHSHQPVVDILLGALQFHPHKEAVPVNNTVRKGGNWWAYEVS